MNREAIERKTIETLRRIAFAGSERKISLNEPLSEQGLGLDSLALVEYITSLEKTFNIEIPDETWIERGQLTLQSLVETLNQSFKGSVATPTNLHPPDKGLGAAQQLKNYTGNVFFLRTVYYSLRRLIRRIFGLLKRIYDHEQFYILTFDLANQSVPEFNPSANVTFRNASNEDFQALEGFWGKRETKKKLGIFHDRFSRNFVCYAAWINNQLVAQDWVTNSEDHEPYTGLTIRMGPGSSYGLDLQEHPKFKNQQIGLSLLSHSLQELKKQGFHKQYSIVSSRNKIMLRSSIQFFGFKKIGEIRTTRIFSQPSSVWKIDNKQGKNKILHL